MLLRTTILAVACSLWLARVGYAQEAGPLFEQSPFDVITLTEEGKNQVINVFPLEFKDRVVPVDQDPKAEIIVRLLIKPETQFKLQWKHIKRIQLFEDLLLAEVDQRVLQQRYEEAFSYYQLLLSKYRKYPGVTASYENYLQKVIELALAQKQYDQALARVFVWHEFNAASAKAAELGAAVLEEYLGTLDNPPTAEQTAQSARWLTELFKRFPQAKSQVLGTLRQKQQQQAQTLLASARNAAEANRADEAERLLQQVEILWPEIPGLDAVRQLISREAPKLAVGLLHGLAPSWQPQTGAIEWRVLRDMRLFSRAPVELVGWSNGVPAYKAQWLGQIESVAPQQLFLPFAANVSAVLLKQRPAMQGLESVHQLWPQPLTFAARGDKTGILLPADLNPAAIEGFCSLARVPPTPPGRVAWAAPLQPLIATGALWTANPTSVYATGPAPAKAVQLELLPIADFETARKKLEDGSLAVMDRIAPWHVPALRNNRDLRIEPYAVPAIHLLLFNPNSAALQSNSARTALFAAIDRPALQAQLSRGANVPGISVPRTIWPELPDAGRKATSLTYPALGAVDVDLAKLLWQAALFGSDLNPASTKLRMLVPADETAIDVAKALRVQLATAGITLDLAAEKHPYLPASDAAREADLLYLVWHPRDPLVAYQMLLQQPEFRGLLNSAATTAWDKLAKAKNSEEVLAGIAQLEEALLADRRLLPMLHVTEYLAHRKNIERVGPRPVDLFQNLEQWRVVPR
jgi:tetratricopeptide (TPR) repeat protein